MLKSMATEAAEILAKALVADAELHEANRYHEIGERYDDVYGELLPLDGASEAPVRVALEFWDGWIDARNHDWLYYEGIGEHDWPRYARVVSDCLRSNRVPRSDASEALLQAAQVSGARPPRPASSAKGSIGPLLDGRPRKNNKPLRPPRNERAITTGVALSQSLLARQIARNDPLKYRFVRWVSVLRQRWQRQSLRPRRGPRSPRQ